MVVHGNAAGPAVPAALQCARGDWRSVTLSLRGAARVAAVAAAAMLIGAPGPGRAQAPNAEDARKRLEADKTLLEETQKRSKELEASAEKINQEMKGITARLVETGKLIQASESRLSAIEAKQSELEKHEKQLRDSLGQRHGTLSTLLAALQRMGRNPPPVMITRRDDALTMVRSAMLLAPAIPELHGQADKLYGELTQLSRVIQSSRVESEKLRAEKAQHDKVRIRLAGLQEAKRQTGAQYEAELRSVRKEVGRIAESVREVSDLLAKLDKEFLGRSYADAKAGGPKVAAVLSPSGQKVVTTRRIEPQIPFPQAKGRLQLPIQGLRVISFGEKTTHGSLSKSIGIRTRFGGTVVSPCDGLVVYAGEFRAYGQLLIISPGDGYHVLIAGLSQIDVQVGQSVLMGEPVGVMSSAGTSQAALDKRGPVLTVEFQKDRRPIDPDPWWSDASRKGQG
jgi:septal ring factor EnvC (AmiA/AmiB activator)